MASLRSEMPLVTAWIDELRQAFGRLDTDEWIKQGLADGSFHAAENGCQVGVPVAAPANAISLVEVVILGPGVGPGTKR